MSLCVLGPFPIGKFVPKLRRVLEAADPATSSGRPAALTTLCICATSPRERSPSPDLVAAAGIAPQIAADSIPIGKLATEIAAVVTSPIA